MKPVRRGIAGFAAAALTATGLSVLSLASAPAAHAQEVSIDNASFTWGLNGYAQKGIFGPWTYKDLEGNVEQLSGSVSGGAQTAYAVDPVPATSMPASTPQKTPNAIKFSEGTGTADPATGEVDIDWTGTYTVNAYPAQYGAPHEIYSDPQLTLDADGNGELTMVFGLGAGVDMDGNPTEAVDLGRLPLMTFSEGSVTESGYGEFRATPDYQGVEVTFPAEEGVQTTCSAEGGATGWWGSWPDEFVSVVPTSVRPHFYSTGCGGMQDNKPALPIDVDLGIERPEGKVTVSQDAFLETGEYTVTVTGTGFDPALGIGTRAPLSGQPAGAYVVFGKFADDWKLSEGAPSTNRVNSSQEWVTPNGVAPGTASLNADGTFEVTLTVSKAAIDAKATAAQLTNYGIYTYSGSGASESSFETFTPITFDLQDKIDAATAVVAADKVAIANVVARYGVLKTEIGKARTSYSTTIKAWNTAKQDYAKAKGAKKAALLTKVRALVQKAAATKAKVVAWTAQSADLVTKSTTYRAKLTRDQAKLADLEAQAGS